MPGKSLLPLSSKLSPDTLLSLAPEVGCQSLYRWEEHFLQLLQTAKRKQEKSESLRCDLGWVSSPEHAQKASTSFLQQPPRPVVCTEHGQGEGKAKHPPSPFPRVRHGDREHREMDLDKTQAKCGGGSKPFHSCSSSQTQTGRPFCQCLTLSSFSFLLFLPSAAFSSPLSPSSSLFSQQFYPKTSR